MALSLSKVYSTPMLNNLNVDIANLFNALSGLEAQTSSLGGLTITPLTNGTNKLLLTNAAGTGVFGVDTSGNITMSGTVPLSNIAPADAASKFIVSGLTPFTPNYVAITGDIALPYTGVAAIASNIIVNDDINATAAIALSKLANGPAANQIIVTGATPFTPAYTPITGDVTLSSGVTAIGSGVIVNDDIKSDAAIVLSKLAAGSAGQIIVAAVTTGIPTYVTMTGDVTIGNTGITAIQADKVTSAMLYNDAASLLEVSGGRMAANASDIALVSGAKLKFDGVALTGDTYIAESAANTLDTYVGGTNILKLTTAAYFNCLVGIGTTASPSTTLHLKNGSGSSASAITLESDAYTYQFGAIGSSIGGGRGNTLEVYNITSDYIVSSLDPSGNYWVKANCSALTYTDRTPYPESTAQAYSAILSMSKNLSGGVDHVKLDPYLLKVSTQTIIDKDTKEETIKTEYGRDLSATVSCLNEVVKDLIVRLNKLEAR